MSTDSLANTVSFETILTHAWYFENANLLYVRFKANTDVSLENVILSNEQTLEALGEKSTKTIYDVRNLEFSHIPREVLNYIADSPHGKYQQSEAFIISGLGQKLMANFYLKVMAPKVPTRMFNTFQSSLEWLEIQNKAAFLKKLNALN